jgi:hypothetical protein
MIDGERMRVKVYQAAGNCFDGCELIRCPTSEAHPCDEGKMSLGTILLIVLVIALLGGFSGVGGGPFYGTGYYGGGGLGLALIIVLILLLMGRI